MFGRKRKEYQPFDSSDGQWLQISPSLQNNVNTLIKLWDHSGDLVLKEDKIGDKKALFVTVDTLVDDSEIRDLTIALKQAESGQISPDLLVSQLDPMKSTVVRDMCEVNQSLCKGSLVVFIDGQDRAVAVGVPQTANRVVARPELEPAILGPQVSFIEDWKTNVNLIRSRIKSNRLKAEYYDIGSLSQSRIVLLYMQGIAKPTLIDEVKKRLQRVQLDAVMDANFIIETINDAPRSIFPTVISTERSDRASAALLDGKFCIVVEGSPIVIIAPIGLFDLMESAEDYYESYIVAFPLRILRHFSFWASIFAPSVYIALLGFQQEMLPTRLLLSLQSSHEGIPFPTVIEAFVMVLIFETLQEAGIRLPRAVGQSVSILGTLIIGDAAVNAGIVSPGMVIVVAMTGIWTFSIPTFTLTFTARLLRYPAMVSAGLFGLTGITIYYLLLLTHILSLRSFGVPYLSLASVRPQKWMASVFRAPFFGEQRRQVVFEPKTTEKKQTPLPRPRRNRRPT